MMRKCRAMILIFTLDIILMCDASNKTDCINKKPVIDLTNFVLTDRSKRQAVLVDITIPHDVNLVKTETDKASKYLDLAHENSAAKIQKLSIQKGRLMAVHNPVTCDGYVLTIFRLTFGDDKPGIPVLIAPGMFQSSDRFLQQTKERSLAYQLQDLGYDVWLFNARGNKYCRSNIYLQSECDEKHEFFDYSYEEIGLLDVAATVEYIISVTLYKKIQFIGHSFGGTYFLVLNSLRPDYNALFDQAFLLAPFAYHRRFRNAALKHEFVYNFKLKELLDKDVVEIFPYKCIRSVEYKFAIEDCLEEQKCAKLCNLLDFESTMGLNKDQNTKSDSRGGSIKQLAHFAQNVLSGIFRRYQFPDKKENTKNYGVDNSPEYDLTLITVPTTIYYTMTDEYIDYKDIQELATKMGNATAVKVAKMGFKHDDFVNSSDATYYVYSAIIKELPENPGSKRPGKPGKGPSTEWNSGNEKTVIWVIISIVGASLCICLCMSIANWVFTPKL